MNKKFIIFGLIAVFLFISIGALMTSKPADKNQRVYSIIKEYSPYYIQKRVGGLTIRNKLDKEFKKKPDNTEFFRLLETLERNWGEKYLSLENNTLSIKDANNTIVKTIELANEDEFSFVKSYYGVQ
ncbi:MAG TPA: hypothetical protein EYG98_02515 [Sulfurovum sp.]|nr:hypothetical protein [Sulfurovum sp.]